MGEVVPLISPSLSPISFSLVGEGGEKIGLSGEMRGKVGGRGGSSHFTPSPSEDWVGSEIGGKVGGRGGSSHFTLTHCLFFSG